MQEQKYKVKNLQTGFECFFFDHSFIPAIDQVKKYVNNVQRDGQFCQVYRRNYSSFGDMWIKI